MKKILTFCAAVLAAMSLSAQITNMTCAEAAQAALLLPENNTPGTDSVAVTGYVTFTDGSISRGQQTFWMDDVKGTVKTFQAYWCNIPGAEGSNGDPVNVGDKVTIKGFLMKYNTTPEMKNGDVVILERAAVKLDTIDVDACGALEEGLALNNGAVTDDYFRVTGVVSSVDKTDREHMQETFWIDCTDTTRFEAYNVVIQDDTVFAEVGDTVEVLGKLKNYSGTIEIASGKVWVIGKGNLGPKPAIEATVAEALQVGNALARKAISADEYLVIGYVDSIITPYDTTYHNISFYMCDDMLNPTYDLQVYRGAFTSDIPVGTKVYVQGKIQHYYKAAEGEKPEVEIIQLQQGSKVYLTDPRTAILNVKDEKTGMKVFENGQIYIIKGDAKYTLLGVEVK